MSSVESTLVEAELWKNKFQRNNKRTGLKNLRCFPRCSDVHKFRGFCGRGVEFSVKQIPSASASAVPSDIYVWAEFARAGSASEWNIGKTISLDEAVSRERTKDDPFKPWIAGQPLEDGPGRAATNVDVLFDFNKQRRGWHYGWVANKHTCAAEHTLRFYTFQSSSGDIKSGMLECVQVTDSPSFSVFCRRRQRQNVVDLPPQLKVQLEYMANERAVKTAQSQVKNEPVAAGAGAMNIEEIAAAAAAAASAASAIPTQEMMISAHLLMSATGTVIGDVRETVSKRKRVTRPNAAAVNEAVAALAAAKDSDEHNKVVVPKKEPKTKRKTKKTTKKTAAKRGTVDGNVSDSNSDSNSNALSLSSSGLFALAVSTNTSPASGGAFPPTIAAALGGLTAKGKNRRTTKRQKVAPAPPLHGIHRSTSTSSLSSSSSTNQRKEMDSMLWRVTFALLNYDGHLAHDRPNSGGGPRVPTPSMPIDKSLAAEALLDVGGHSERRSSAGSGIITPSGGGGGGAWADDGPLPMSMPATPVGNNYIGGGHDDFATSIADCLDYFLPEIDMTDELGPFGSGASMDPFHFLAVQPSNPFRSSASVGTVNTMDDALDIEDDVDMEQQSMSGHSNMDNEGPASGWSRAKKEFVVEELAHFLVGERSLTELLSSTFTKELASTLPAEQLKRRFLSVMQTHLTKFAEHFHTTIEEIDTMIAAKLCSGDMGVAAGPDAKDIRPYTELDIGGHLSRLCTSPRGDDAQQAKMPAWPTLSSTSTIPLATGSNKSDSFLQQQLSASMSAAASDTQASYDTNNTSTSTVSATPTTPEVAARKAAELLAAKPTESLPMLAHAQDFTGTWIRDESSLQALEQLRTSIGVPWVIRKIFKKMEARIVITHRVGRMDVQNTRKLLSSGFQRYVMDGEDHSWDMPPPFFTGRPVGVSCSARMEGVDLVIMHRYSKLKRIVRRARKSEDGNELNSVLTYQQRRSGNEPWVDVYSVKVGARREVPLPLA